LPLLVVIVSTLAVGAIWTWPGQGFIEVQRRFATWLLGFGTFLALGLWLIGGSKFSWTVRLGCAALIIGGWYATVREFEVSGNGSFLPSILFRWQPTNDDMLDRQRQESTAATGTVVLDEATAFPEYRGRKRDGIVLGPPLNRDWAGRPPRLLWSRRIGGGYAAFAVAGNLAVTIEQRRDQEVVTAYDTATGTERWAHSYDAHFKEKLGGPGPRATPTIADGDVYSLGATGHLVCLEAVSGKEKWSVDILRDNDNIMWGMSGSPLVYDNLVVVNPGAQSEQAGGRAVVAYDRKTGAEVWKAGNAPAGYSSPMLATFGGKRQVLLLDGTGLSGYDAATGQEMWRYPWETYQNINVAQPVVLDGDRLCIAAGYNHGGALLKIAVQDGNWSATPLWENRRTLHCKFTSPVLYQGHLYFLDEFRNEMACVDAATGKVKWTGGKYEDGQLLLCGDLLVVVDVDGALALVAATPEKFTELGKIQALQKAKTWNLPAIADGKVYLRNHQEMACYDLR
jgi:outer membrane protein assembly factor BamB